jgi:hypothetical protein
MVTLDRIRLTGLLRKTPANAGVFYSSFAGGIVIVSAPPIGAVSLEPLDAGARPFAFVLWPASRRAVAAGELARQRGRKRLPARLAALACADEQARMLALELELALR